MYLQDRKFATLFTYKGLNIIFTNLSMGKRYVVKERLIPPDELE